MSTLAIQGGKPVTKDITGGAVFRRRTDLERKYLLETYDSGQWDDWPGANSQAAIFAKEWAAFNRSKHCEVVTNGTHTLQLAFESLGIGFGDEVIVPGLTWQATASTVVDVNAVPVLVDIDPETLCLDATKIEAAITKRTRAIVPVHLYHRMADMDAILKIARKHGLAVVEDCAHTHGSQWDGKGAGTLGDFGSYSFQMSKTMTAGEGGALLMQDETNCWKVVSQRCCGREFKPGVKVHSGNYRMTSLQGAILRGQLVAMKEWAPVMDRNGRALDQAIAAAPGVKALRRNKHITRQCGYCFAFRFMPEEWGGVTLDAFRKALSAEIGAVVYGPYTPLNHSEVYDPQLKRRHALSREYLKAITPSRWELRVTNQVVGEEACLMYWKQGYAIPPKRAGLMTEAIAKLYANRAALVKS